MSDNRRSPFLAILLAVAAIGMAVTGFLVPGGAGTEGLLPGIPWLSHVLALLSVALVAVSLDYVNSNCYLFSSDSKLLYLPYMLSVLSLPSSIVLTPYHVAALLMVWSMLFAVRYVNSERQRFDYAFVAILISGIATLLVPPLLFMQALIFLYCLFRRSQDPGRYVLTSLAAAVLPWIYVLSWMYVSPDTLSTGYLVDFRQSLRLQLPGFSETGLSGLIVSSFALLLIIRALVFVSLRKRERNKAQKNAFGLSVALSVVAVLTLVFCGGSLSPMVVMVAAVPVSFAVFDLFTNGRRQEVNVWIVLLLLATVLSRVVDFFPLS